MEHSKNKFYLIQNYRSTPEIVNLVNELKPWKNIIPDIISTKESNGKKPIVYSSNLKNIINHMTELLEKWKNEGIDMKDVAIIGPVKKSKENSFGNFNNIGLQYFVNYFDDNKIPYVKHYTETTSDCEIVNTKAFPIENHINLYTIHGSKGLEFKKVFLLNFHTNTYGRNPTFKDYNNFRYLWYVGLSRACDEMIIYCDYNKNVWWELSKCKNNNYKFMGKQIKFIEPIFEKVNKRPSSITELLKTKEIFTEEIIMELKEYLNFEIIEEEIYNNENINIIDFEEYSSLYGKYIEQIFEYLYCKKRNKVYLLTKLTKQFISNRISLSKKFQAFLQGFLNKIGKTQINLLELEYINEIKNSFTDIEKDMYEEIILKTKEKNIETFSIYIPNELVYDNPEEILKIANKLENNNDANYNLFLLNLYFYQIEHEAKYLWKKKEEIFEKFKSTNKIIDNISNYVDSLNETDFEFQIPITSKYLEDFSGVIDVYDYQNKNIIEIKFTKNTTLLHYLQLFIYNFIKNNSINKLEKMTILNFYEGKKINLKINSDKIDSFQLLLKFSKILNTKIRNLVILYDLETTGLIEEDKYPEIIDRYFYEINLDSVIDSGLVIPNKPISNEIYEITKIDNDILQKEGVKYEIFFKNFIELNNMFEYPTYIAHNGNRFDHKILAYYNLINYSRVKLLDSRQIIINFAKIKGKLGEMYTQITGKEVINAHRAEYDVKMVLEIIKKINISQLLNLN